MYVYLVQQKTLQALQSSATNKIPNIPQCTLPTQPMCQTLLSEGLAPRLSTKLVHKQDFLLKGTTRYMYCTYVAVSVSMSAAVQSTCSEDSSSYMYRYTCTTVHIHVLVSLKTVASPTKGWHTARCTFTIALFIASPANTRMTTPTEHFPYLKGPKPEVMQ